MTVMDGRSVANTYGPDYYDRTMGAPDSRAREPLEGSKWRRLYYAAAQWVDPPDRVIDLGCGTGRFAKALAERGVRSYLGIDFAPEVVAEARRYVQGPGFGFEVLDLRNGVPQEPDSLYTCLEVLEHLEDDLGLIRQLPDGARLLFTVPSFDAEAHVRFFPHTATAFERYGQAVAVSRWERVGHGKKTHINLFLGTVRGGIA